MQIHTPTMLVLLRTVCMMKVRMARPFIGAPNHGLMARTHPQFHPDLLGGDVFRVGASLRQREQCIWCPAWTFSAPV